MTPDRAARLTMALTTLVALLMTGPPAAARYIDCRHTNAESCYGTPQDDHIQGSQAADRIVARRGKDYVEGGKGDDVVHAGAGQDVVKGEEGDDTIHLGSGGPAEHTQTAWGQRGDDTIFGGPQGRERLLGGAGRDRLEAGGGDDYLEPGSGRDVVKAGAGDDEIDAAQMHNELTPGSGTLRIFGGRGSDNILLLDDDAVDYIDCGDGVDTVTWPNGRDDQDILDDCENLPT